MYGGHIATTEEAAVSAQKLGVVGDVHYRAHANDENQALEVTDKADRIGYRAARLACIRYREKAHQNMWQSCGAKNEGQADRDDGDDVSEHDPGCHNG